MTEGKLEEARKGAVEAHREVVASAIVSCFYGLTAPEAYTILRRAESLLYERGMITPPNYPGETLGPNVKPAKADEFEGAAQRRVADFLTSTWFLRLASVISLIFLFVVLILAIWLIVPISVKRASTPQPPQLWQRGPQSYSRSAISKLLYVPFGTFRSAPCSPSGLVRIPPWSARAH